MLRPQHQHITFIASAIGSLAFAAAPLAQTEPTTQPHAQSHSSSPTQMPSSIPSRSEIASSAFEKLDASHLGYVSKDKAAKLDGFSTAFAQADKDKDGKLDRDEFQVAWAIYTQP